MISNALNIGAAASPGLPDPAVGSRGEPNHPMSWSDLVEFGRSPHRWRFWRPEPDERSWTWEDIVRGYAVVPSLATRQFTPRPRTYPAMVNTCPGCRSTGVAETCRKCGLRRRMVSAERPWAGTAEYCRNWTEATIKAGSFVVSADDHDRALAAVDKLNADQAVASTRTEASVWQTFSATWHDADTGLDIPVRADVQIVPEESTNLSDVLAGVYVSRNAAPGPWAIQVIGRQAHVEAALLLDIVSLARGEARTRYLWCIVEAERPFLIARREPTPELIAAGRTAYEQLLGAYARCLKRQLWPTFDVLTENISQAWSGVSREMWMSEADARASTFFGVDAGLALAAN